MKLIEVKQNKNSSVLVVNYAIHNVCNYKCWYCFPGSNEGTHRWPDLDVILKNFIYLLNYYKMNLKKDIIELNLLGGEPTLWPELGDFVRGLKNEFKKNIRIMLTTNGSRTLSWWERNGKYFDRILISVHLSEAKKEHIRNLADLLYDMSVYVDVSVLMDSFKWDESVSTIEYFKLSKRRWSIRSSQVIHEKTTYTEDQKKYLQKYLKRRPNFIWEFLNHKHDNYSIRLKFKDGSTKKVRKNYLLINELNYFNGWECNIGVDNITIHFNGELSSSCDQTLYQIDYRYNLYDKNFIEIFSPLLKPAICTKQECWCEHEFNTSKKFINSSKNFIPIKSDPNED